MPTVIATLGGISRFTAGCSLLTYLATTVMTPIWGKVADVVDGAPPLGLAVFLIGSALSGAAQTMPQLIIYRVLQGPERRLLFP
jgi:MFS family permease